MPITKPIKIPLAKSNNQTWQAANMLLLEFELALSLGEKLNQRQLKNIMKRMQTIIAAQNIIPKKQIQIHYHNRQLY